jgi:hypothetical protein
MKKSLVGEVSQDSWKKPLARLWDGTKVFTVVGRYLRDNVNDDFTLGGHGYVYDFIPKDEIWVEELDDKQDQRMNLVHEIFEWSLMKYGGVDYESAHVCAANVEQAARK